MWILATVLALSACSGATQRLNVDGTEPVSDENRVIYQMNVGAFTAEGTFQAATQQLGRLDTLDTTDNLCLRRSRITSAMTVKG